MPQARKESKIHGHQGTAIRTVAKIGGRSSVKSAARMSTEELTQAYESKGTRGRDRAKIKRELDRRGVDLTPQVEEAEPEFKLEA